MLTAPPLAPSGVSAVDARWGGLRTGGTYVVVGAAADGRDSLTLQMVRAVVDGGGRCLLLSPRDPAVLRTAARAVGLDLAEAHAGGRLRLLRMPAASSLRTQGDDGMDRAFDDLAGLVRGDRPDRVVIEDLGPLFGFDDPARLGAALQRLATSLRPIDATLVVGISTPADTADAQRVAAAETIATGTLRIVTDAGPRRLALSVHRGDDDAPDATADAPARPAATPSAAQPATPPAATPPAATSPAPEASPLTADAPTEPASVPPSPPVRTALPTLEPEPVHDTGILPADLSAPPEVDPGLLSDTTDVFGVDAAASFLEQGFLVDSALGGIAGRVPSAAPPPPPPPPAKASPPLDRSSLGALLDAAFMSGQPFTVVAARMAPTSPHAPHFPAVAEGLQAGLGPADGLHVDTAGLRAVALVRNTSDAAPLFAALQRRIRTSLGELGAEVLASVGAAQIPNGAPFKDAAGLLAYALDQ